MRAGEVALPLTYCSILESSPAAYLGSTVKLTLMAGVLVGRLPECKHAIIGFTTCLPYSDMGERDDLLPHPLSPPMTSRRAGPKVIRAVELALPLTYYST